MTLEEIRTAKGEAEAKISAVLKDLAIRAGLRVTGADVETIVYSGIGAALSEVQISGVRVRIEMERI